VAFRRLPENGKGEPAAPIAVGPVFSCALDELTKLLREGAAEIISTTWDRLWTAGLVNSETTPVRDGTI